METVVILRQFVAKEGRGQTLSVNQQGSVALLVGGGVAGLGLPRPTDLGVRLLLYSYAKSSRNVSSFACKALPQLLHDR